MKNQMLKILVVIAALLLLLAPPPRAAWAAEAAPASAAVAVVAPDPVPDPDRDADDDDEPVVHEHHHGRHHHDGNDVFHAFGDSHLDAATRGGDVVSIFGSSTSEGEAEDVVSIFGNSTSTGALSGDIVAVFGNVRVDGEVHGDVVAVFGNVELGPQAVIDGDVNAVIGTVRRDPAAVIRGEQHVVGFGAMPSFEWLHSWLRECLAKGRPLALAPGLTWAWTLALSLLGVYLLVALLFKDGINRCVETLEREPGHSALAAILMILLVPVLLVVLCLTVVGIAAVPFVVMALVALSLFGKAVILAWLGGRALGGRPVSPVLAVLLGGAIATALYLVPFLGFLVYKLLGFFGVGAVAYTLVRLQRARQDARADRLHEPPPGTPGATAYATSAAAGAPSGEAFAAAGVAGASAAGTPPAADPARRLSAQDIATLPRAGFWVRMVALGIDFVLIGFLLSLGHGFGHGGAHQMHLVVLATYGAIMWKLRGSTIGGLALDLRVVRTDGRPVEWETAIVRALGCFLSLFVVGLGFLWIAIDPQRQAWHDKIAGTAVVRVPKGTPLP